VSPLEPNNSTSLGLHVRRGQNRTPQNTRFMSAHHTYRTGGMVVNSQPDMGYGRP